LIYEANDCVNAILNNQAWW